MLALVVAFALASLIAFLASAAEFAVMSLAEPAVKELRAGRRRGALQLAAFKARPLEFLVTVWTLRIAATAAAGLIAWRTAISALGAGRWSLIVAALVTVSVILLAEIIAKTLALRAAERLALWLCPPLWFSSRPLVFLLRPLEWLVRSQVRRLGKSLPRMSEQEIRVLVSPGNSEQQIEAHERRLIERAFLLDQTTAYDVMTPRVDMFAWADTRTLADITPELRNIHYSRVPLYDDSVDKITGVLYIRDAFQALVSGQRDVELRSLAREPFFVPGSITIDKLLLDFQARRIHLGIVIDEYGGVDGVITLEDILEELVGEIVDETDVAEEKIARLSRTEILVDGGADLREINHFFNSTFPLEEHRSLNGYLLDILGHVPAPGEKIVREGVLIEIREATETQVVRARLSRVTPGSVYEDEEQVTRVEDEGAGPDSKATSDSVEGRSAGKTT